MFSHRKKKEKRDDWDDGRTIASMNVDGMPWYDPRESETQRPDRPVIGEDGQEIPDLPDDHLPFQEKEQLSGKDLRKVIFTSTIVGIGIALIFVAAAFILIELMLIFWT